MKCKKCGKEHDGSFGSGKFCSRACANSRIRTEETKKKISESILKTNPWSKIDYSYNSNPEFIQKRKNTWKEKRDFNTAHIWSIKRWIKEERGNKCEECGITEWLGNPITMEVDHIDGDKNNNSLDNLKILCPNCHSQTPTWRGRKK